MRERAGASWAWAWTALGRTLTFRLHRQDVDAFDRHSLVLGLAVVWLVGMGRSWDDPHAVLLQRLGVGSLLYVFALACLLWLIALPVATQRTTYMQTLVFVAMTSPPGLVYAVPVEWWTDANTAAALNGGALVFVAVYRVALLLLYYRRAAVVHPAGAVLLTLVPLVLIMVVLALLRLGPVALRGMAGVRSGAPTVAEQIDEIIVGIGIYSLLASPVIVVAYAYWICIRVDRARSEA